MHVVARGNNRETIFRNASDYLLFERLLMQSCAKFNAALLTHTLMPNHPHMLIRPTDDNLPAIMHRTMSVYAREWNKENGRVGHVFEKRYWARAVLNDSSLLRASRYIHRNPIEAGLVSRAEDWRWSGMGIYSGLRENYGLDTGPILKAIGSGGGPAYSEFVNGGRDPECCDDWYAEEAASVCVRAEGRVVPDHLRERSLEILAEMAKDFGLSKDVWGGQRRPRRVVELRRMAAGRLRKELRLTLTEIAGLIGVTPTAVSKMLGD